MKHAAIGIAVLLATAGVFAQTVAEKLAVLDLAKPLSAIDAIDRAAWQARVDRITLKCHDSNATHIGDMLVKSQQIFAERGVRKRLAEIAWLVDVTMPKGGVPGKCEEVFSRAVGRDLDGLPTIQVDPGANVYRPKP